jgi:predicted anti-sigma-YlaC factor YlaD
MNCEQNELWMMDALDGVLAAPNRQRLEAHIETCDHCRAEWDALKSLDQILAASPMIQPAPGFAVRVEARWERYEAQRRTLLGGLILLGAAAALCLLAVPSLLNGRNPIDAYGAFLQNAYELSRYVILLSYKLVSALWFTLNTLARSADIPLLNLLTYVAGIAMAIAAWRRSLESRQKASQTARNGH